LNFSEKLDFLFDITEIKNNTLARFVHLDPSFISRLRSGERTPSKNENYTKPIALFFSKHIKDRFQKAALCDVLNVPLQEFPDDEQVLANLIHQWFVNKSLQNNATVKNFIDTLTKPVFKDKFLDENFNTSTNNYPKSEAIDTFVYYGVEGKRKAALEFLSMVADCEKPQTLLLFSDEDIEWLVADLDFVANWSMLLAKIATKGNSIKIIHTVSRNLDDMLSAINQWLPLYMTGAIEPYYYPKKRDGVFQRTLFIAPGTAAVISSSVGQNINNTANFLFKDKKTLLALVNEFDDFFSLCRPLMKIFTQAKTKELFNTLFEFEEENSRTLIMSDTLSTVTIPSEVYKSISSRTGIDLKRDIFKLLELRIKSFEDSLQNNEFTEIVEIPDFEKITSHKVKIAFSNLFSDVQLFYTPLEFLLHIENLIRLLKNYENFQVILRPKLDTSGFMLYVKEDVGVLVAKTSLPFVMFAINESNLTAAFWDYAKLAIEDYYRPPPKKSDTIKMLEKIVDNLKKE
jgi:hypothetical protein